MFFYAQGCGDFGVRFRFSYRSSWRRHLWRPNVVGGPAAINGGATSPCGVCKGDASNSIGQHTTVFLLVESQFFAGLRKSEPHPGFHFWSWWWAALVIELAPDRTAPVRALRPVGEPETGRGQREVPRLRSG